jgi:hypothetical protein
MSRTGGQMKIKWDDVVRALVLVRLGQELGTDSQLARAVFLAVEAVQWVPKFFPVDKF